MYFFVNASSPLQWDVSTLNSHMMSRVLGNILCDHDHVSQGQIMFFLVNASPLPLALATSNFAGT